MLWVVATVVLLGAFVVVERRAAEPILPVELLRTPVVARSLTVVFLVGFALFGAISFIPLFVQGVLGGTATRSRAGADAALPRLGGHVGRRREDGREARLPRLGDLGQRAHDDRLRRPRRCSTPRRPGCCCSRAALYIGGGMGTQMLSLLLAVQHGVDRSRLGLATSLNQFSRSIGAAVGVAAMGAVLARGLSGVALPAGGSDAIAAGVGALSGPARMQLAAALHRVFLMGTVVSGAGLVATFFLPSVDLSSRVRGTASRPAAAPDAQTPVALPE